MSNEKEFEDKAKEFVDEAKQTVGEFADNAQEVVEKQDNKKVLAGLLAIIIGSFGIHKFILGYQKEGIIMLLCSILSCGFLAPIIYIIGIVEGFIYLTKSDEDFYNTYQVGKKPWF